ncbi:MAG TPA: hypothetical protein PKL04_07515 [Methanofastidiosum sp.]|nr:hypothetical protein [Methanofastidiosum sp.]
MTKKLFKFEDKSMLEDLVNPSGKVIRYRVVFTISTDEETARNDANLDVGYSLISSYDLPEGWDV